MIERYVKIKNFRNIGEDAAEKLIINYSKNPKSKMGGIVTLIGANNSGKSNFLDAILFLSSGEIKESDIPMHHYSKKTEPTVSLYIQDQNKKMDYQYLVKSNYVFMGKYHNDELIKEGSEKPEDSESYDLVDKTLRTKDLEYWTNLFQQSAIEYPQKNYTDTLNRFMKRNYNRADITILTKALEHNRVKRHLINYGVLSASSYDKMIGALSELTNTSNHSSKYMTEVEETYGIALKPKIIKYDDKLTFKNIDTFSNVNKGKIENTKFFKMLFELLDGLEYSQLEDAYLRFSESGGSSKYLLTNFNKEVNKALQTLSKSFNKVYAFKNNLEYKFTLDLESEKIYFLLEENGTNVSLESQSTGFKWFFNFFFNVFADKTLKNGDIVILDEPATNLHVRGQIELRKQLKAFGEKEGITFIISTHSPFLIDADYFDELRIVVKEGYVSKVENHFHEATTKKADILLPIHSALTVDRHILMNPNSRFIFVEGVTDYNYLVAFKHMFDEYRHMSFIPVNGLDKTDVLVKSLFNITDLPIILVDSDRKGKGFVMKHKDKNNLEVIEINVGNNKTIVKTIEDLFSEEDKKKYCSEKTMHASAWFKNHLINNKIKLKNDTIQNFKTLFKYISV